jgi:outer membrane lipoprotein carrier protein
MTPPIHHRLGCLLLLAFASPLAVGSSLLDDFASDLRGLEGRFEQRVTSADGDEIERSAGRVAIAAPRQFRWEYESPFPQLIVADGERVFIYDPDLEQVTVRRQSDEEQSSPLAALIEPGALERQFVVERGEARDGVEWFRLTPRGEDTAFAVCELGIRAGELVEMQMTDSLGQRTDIRFSHWLRNPDFAPGTFRFAPPPGVDVVGDVPEVDVYPLQD